MEIDAKQLRAVDKTFGSDRHAHALRNLRETVDGAEWIKFSTSSTGNDITLQFKLPGRRAALRMKVGTHAIDEFEQDKYSEESVMEDLWRGLCKHWELDKVLEDTKRWCGRDRMDAFQVNRALAAGVLDRAPAFKKLLYATVRRFRNTGEHRGKSNEHQSQLALKDMRVAVVAALRHGTTREQLLAVVDEEIVRQVMEA